MFSKFPRDSVILSRKQPKLNIFHNALDSSSGYYVVNKKKECAAYSSVRLSISTYYIPIFLETFLYTYSQAVSRILVLLFLCKVGEDQRTESLKV